MPTATIVAPLLLAVVLAYSGAAKLRDPQGVDDSFRQMGVHPALDQAWIRRLFPWLEIALAILMVIVGGPVALLVAFAAVALFAAYLLLVWRAVQRPEPVSCGCFGAASAAPVSQLTVLRNFALLIVAVVAFFDALHGHAPLLRLYITDAGWWLLAFAGAAFVAFVLLAEQGFFGSSSFLSSLRGEGAPVAPTPAALTDAAEEDYVRLPIPYAALERPDGSRVTLRDLARTEPVLLVFASPTCGSCTQVLGVMDTWRTKLGPVAVHPVVATAGSLDADFPALSGQELVDPGFETMRLLEAYGTPSALLLGADGLLAGGPVAGGSAVLQFVDDIAEELAAHQPTALLDAEAPGVLDERSGSTRVERDADEAVAAEFGLARHVRQ